MIDSIGGCDKVNNFLSTMNMRPLSQNSLKAMERRAGDVVETVAAESCRKAAQETLKQELRLVKAFLVTYAYIRTCKVIYQ